MASAALSDRAFLKKLDEFQLREIYVRIISLTLDEHPIDEIQGRATAGSINIDGNSAVRRTCSLTLICDDLELRDYYWGLKTKFKLEIGMKNFVDSNYEDIIWFPQGIYLITSFSTTQNATGYTVNISGKDKMVLLNGELGGKIHANSTRLDIIEDYDEEGNKTETKIPIRQIIQEVVHEYGNEPLHNIIINDVDDYGLELLEYVGKKPLYMGIDINNRLPQIITFSANNLTKNEEYRNRITGVNGKRGDWKFDPMISDTFGSASIVDSLLYGSTNISIAEITKGQAAGYRLTPLIYADDLVINLGETVTGILDKLKNFFNDFEYFYDLDGRFIFQRKPVSTFKSLASLKSDQEKDKLGRLDYYSESIIDNSRIAYQFFGDTLLTQISNAPNFGNIKNDYSIWGKRKTASGVEIPIHLRYAIQQKPTSYTKISSSDGGGYDLRGGWREMIYQMALDYRRCNHDSDFEYKLKQANPDLVKNGRTGYEQYYIDMEGFWRQIFDPTKTEEDGFIDGWNKAVTEAPETLNFWIDFLDQGPIMQYSVDAIGDRAQTVNNDKIRSVYNRTVPMVIYYDGNSDDPINLDRSKSGYSYYSMGDQSGLFTISSQGKSAKDELEVQLQKYTYATENLTLTSLPIYYLEPGTKIEVSNDDNLNVNGEYIISKITLPLTHNGTMSLTATKDMVPLI